MLQGRRSGRIRKLGRPIRRALRDSGYSTTARMPEKTMSSVLAWSPPSVILNPQGSMTVDSLQETTSNCLDLQPSFSRSASTTVTEPYRNGHSDLQSYSQSRRLAYLQSSYTRYYELSVFNDMQSTSNQEPKVCKKRNPASNLRHGFVGKRSTSMKKTNASAFGPLRVQCPEAPRNTTAFLIEDLEQREFRDSTPPSTSVSPTTRGRSPSTCVNWCSEKLMPTCFSEYQSFSYDDFEFMNDVVHREKLDTVNRNEINRELRIVEEQNRDLTRVFTKLRQENDFLRQLLKANGIDPHQAIASNC